MVNGQSFGSSPVCLACITSMCSVHRFPGGHSLRLAFGSFFYPPPRYSSTDKSVWQAPGSIGVGTHGRRAGLPALGASLCLGADCAKGRSPWTSQAPTSTSDVVIQKKNNQKLETKIKNDVGRSSFRNFTQSISFACSFFGRVLEKDSAWIEKVLFWTCAAFFRWDTVSNPGLIAVR